MTVRFCHFHAEGRCYGKDEPLAEDYDEATVWWACEGHTPCWDHEGNDRPILDLRRYDPTRWVVPCRGWTLTQKSGRWLASKPLPGHAGVEIEIAHERLEVVVAAVADFARTWR